MKTLEEELQSKFPSERHKAFLNLIYTHNKVNHYQLPLFRAIGLSAQQYNLLRILRGQSPEPATMGSIKARMLEPDSDVSRLVDNLEGKDLVKRVICEADRRVVHIHLTDEGLALMDQSRAAIDQLGDLLAGLDEQELQVFNQLLDKIRFTLPEKRPAPKAGKGVMAETR